ncbi:hypothetical protein AAFF_G00407730 [Aldrovandia affinis]|uniref:Uncharacterized protein n=1 Tax=Aldrovandia affinis TaxID=143900 RepID=A0AAD7SCA3_9TELE|nr:hypothetical protein AAFF_G00407730 [Aldrovandia affinis]
MDTSAMTAQLSAPGVDKGAFTFPVEEVIANVKNAYNLVAAFELPALGDACPAIEVKGLCLAWQSARQHLDQWRLIYANDAARERRWRVPMRAALRKKP